MARNTTTDPPACTDHRLLPTRQVCGRYGVADRTIDRWLSRRSLGFPKPIVVNRRRYWRQAELDEWERSRVSAV